MSNLKMKKSKFGTLSDGSKVHIYTVSNGRMSFSAIDLGCTLTSVLLPKKNGLYTDILLGHSSLEGFVNTSSCVGSFVGRYANRIADGRFSLDGKKYELDRNDGGKNFLHGGYDCWGKKIWDSKKIKNRNGLGVEFSRFSPDGEQGLPGNAFVRVTYTLNENNELTLEYKLTTDRPTPVNLTNHAYFNLKGTDAGTVADHEFTLACSRFLEVDDTLVPTGKILNAKDNPVYDFTQTKTFSADIDSTQDGYDTPYLIDDADGSLKTFAVLKEPVEGKMMTVSTTLPVVQVYTGNYMEGYKGKNGRIYHKHDAVCIEPQEFPDAPIHPEFPGAIASPTNPYRSLTVYRFGF